MSDFDLVVRGTIVSPVGPIDDGWIAVRNGRIALNGSGNPPAAKETHDARGAWLFPGVIDAQVHSRSMKGQEGFESASRAAASGGVTVMCDMPYDDGCLISTVERFNAKRADAEAQSHVDVALFATIDPTEGVESIPDIARAGACSFKFSTFESHPTRFPRIPTPMLRDAFARVASTGLAASVHNENQEVIAAQIARAAEIGMTGPESHAWTRPPLNEALAMLEIYEIGAATGARSHVVHCSIGRGIEICNAYKQQGFAATVEVLLPFLFLNEEDDVRKLGGYAKINPPIRSKTEMEALWKHIASGHVDIVSTDHVCWTHEKKNDPNMLKNSSGIPGIDLLLPLFVTGCLRRGISLGTAARLLSFNPARHFGFMPFKGALEPGCDADIAIVEPGKHTYHADRSETCIDWSPYDGWQLDAKVAATYLRGAMVWDGASILTPKGTGRFLRPTGT